jgi:hypothetical protein
MRKSTKTLIALIGTAVVALGVVVNFTSVQEVKASWSSETYGHLPEIAEGITDSTPDVASTPDTVETPDVGPTPEQIQQERITAQAAADREALVNEGVKNEHRMVKNADGTVDGSALIGLYLLNDIKGIAYKPSIASQGSELHKSYCVAYEVDAAKCPASIATVNEIAQNVNAVVGPSVNFQYGKVVDGVVTANSEAAEGTMKMGLDPSFAGEGDKVAVVAVYPGGATKIFEDTDNDPTTISVNVPATDSSLVMYSIIKYN